MPAFILAGEGVPFDRIPAKVSGAAAEKYRVGATLLLRPETLQMFLRAVEALRAAGAEVVVDAGLLPAAFAKTASRSSLRRSAARNLSTPSAGCGLNSVFSTLIPMPSAITTRRSGRRWRHISKRWIA